MIEIKNACIDDPKARDYSEEDCPEGYLGSVKEFPEEFILDNVEYQNQYSNDFTKMACTCFAMSHAIQEENFHEFDGEIPEEISQYTGYKLWEELKEKSLTHGAKLQDARELGRKLGLIAGYFNVRNINSIKEELMKGNIIHTGTNKCDWQKMKKNGNGLFVKVDKGPGHSFDLIGWNKVGFYGKGSSGKNAWIDGKFIVPYENVNDLFTRAVIIDKKNTDLIKKMKIIKDKKTIQKTIENGFYSGDRPKEPITREDTALIVGRMYEKVLKLLEK